ncbi:MAG: histidine kinase [Bacteroidia bacterium]
MYKNRKAHIKLLIFIFAFPISSWAQDLLRFQNLGVSDGLSMGTITAVQKDANGYVWAATAEGLHRFDGKNFKVFKHIDGVKGSISDSYILTLLAHGDILYIGNHSGMVDLFDINTHEVTTLELAQVDESFDYPITCLSWFQDRLIIGTEGGGVWTYSPQNEQLEKHAVYYEISPIITDVKVKEKHCYISSLTAIYRCTKSSSELLFRTEGGSISSFDFSGSDIIFGGNSGLFKWHSRDGSITVEELPKRKRRVKNITDIVVSGEEQWIATMGGLVYKTNGQIQHYTSNNTRPYSLVNNQINHLFVDDEQIVWVGTIGGLSRYAPQLKKFGLLQYFDFKGKSHNNNVYYIYYGKDDFIWLGTLSGGLIKLNLDHQIVDVFPVISDGEIETKAVRCIYEDSKGNFWVGTRDEGLFLFDESRRSFKHMRGVKDFEISNNIIRAIYEDSKERLWIGTQSGLNRYDVENNKYYHFSAEPASIANNSIYQITEDPNSGQLILASFRGGLQFFNPRSKHFVSLKYHADDSTSISNNNLMCMQWINSDTLLIGTYGGGLNILDMESKIATHITERNGLVNNAVYGILYEGNGKVWLSTNNGVVQYHLYNKSFTNFKPVHYLQNTEFNEGAFASSPNGEFYFGGVSGFNFFKPKTIAYDTSYPSLKITGIRGEYKNLKQSEIQLSFLNSRLEIDFMALHYSNPEGVIYKYKLLGYDQVWVESSHNNTAIYPRLSPGHYSFQVVAEDEFGQWLIEPVLLKVYVKPPFWQMWWFIVLVLLVIGAAIYSLFKFRTREIERSYKLQLVDSELSALRSQMNPHFIFNSLNSIQYFILQKQPKEAYTYLSKFASLMRKILQNSRLKYISIEDEVEWLELYLEMEKMRMDNTLEYEIDVSGVDDISQSFIPTMLIQPYVENSIIHGLLPKEEDRKISISFVKREKHVDCMVEDNGIGRDASKIMNERRRKKHNSAGMALTKTRLRILSEGKGDFDVQIEDLHENGVASGTRVNIMIPLIEQDQ